MDSELNILEGDMTSDSENSDKENSLPGPSRCHIKQRGRPSKKRNIENRSDDNGTSIKQPCTGKRGATVTQIVSSLCCDLLCLSVICMQVMVQTRADFSAKSSHDQKTWMLDYFRTHSEYRNGRFAYTYCLGTTKICCFAWQLILGLKKTRFYSIRKEFEEGVTSPVHPGFEKRFTFSMSTQETLSWLESYSAKCADKLPTTGKLHLPSCLTRHDVYLLCKGDLEEQGIRAASESHFLTLWRRNLPHIVIPKVNRFARCDKCTILKTKLQETRDKRIRAALSDKRAKHLRQQNAERRKYYKHAAKARTDADKYMSIIIDGMDQSKTCVPHFTSISKSISSIWKLRTHVTGVIVHGVGSYGFLDCHEWPHSSNLTLNVLLHVLSLHRDKLPSVLYVQLDNCGRENKNRYVFGFLCLLLKLRIFKKIKLSFLMVGHTHEDIDQLFSRFSCWLAKHNALTIRKLLGGFEKCSSPNPCAVTLESMYDISEWLLPHMEDIAFHSKPHVFKFVLDSEGNPTVTFKKWSTDTAWMNCTGAAHGVLLKGRPPGFPLLVKPNFDTMDFFKLQCDVKTVLKFMPLREDQQWWLDWFEEKETQVNGAVDYDEEDEANWALPGIVEAVRQRESEAPQLPSASDQCQEGDLVSDEDAPVRPVKIGKNVPKEFCKPSETLSVGHMCLLDIPKYADNWPQVAQVVSLDMPKVSVKWYKGSTNSKFTPYVLMKKGSGRVPWEETVHANQIWHWGFSFTREGYLPLEIKNAAKDYLNYD